ncbi:ras-related protein Rab-20 [Nothobranchius furzeri]|uniref:Ras-related protein Rab-20 n=4 Tax=Nothobranchius TaxID=28779 RepID=A0A8C6NMX7_NOTFU|nr:ras-related protein Rab-20 [Nothobranchius furzeri]KAF7215655.1 member RAS oncogene family [Nothobranchius furzeri]
MPDLSKMKKPDVKVVLLGDMNVGKTSLLHRYMERKFKDTVSTVGGAFFLKQWGPYNISIWDTAGREQFHGLGSMYCRGAAAVILTYDVTNWQSLAEIEERFLSLTDTANHDCIYALVGNKADLTDPKVHLSQDADGQTKDPTGGDEERTEPQVLSAVPTPPASPTSFSGLVLHKQVTRDDALSLYERILRYKGLDEKSSLPADKMCFETSAKTGYNVDVLFETLFDLVLPSILRKRHENRESPTVDLEDSGGVGSKRARSSCC